MTMAQVTKRLAALERKIDHLTHAMEYQQAVEGIRRGLDSADRGEGVPAAKAFTSIRRKYRAPRRRK
jgi:hypothetical protein